MEPEELPWGSGEEVVHVSAVLTERGVAGVLGFSLAPASAPPPGPSPPGERVRAFLNATWAGGCREPRGDLHLDALLPDARTAPDASPGPAGAHAPAGGEAGADAAVEGLALDVRAQADVVLSGLAAGLGSHVGTQPEAGATARLFHAPAAHVRHVARLDETVRVLLAARPASARRR